VSGILVQAEGRSWRLLAEPEPREADRLQAILSVQLFDELTEAPPRLPIEVSTQSSGLFATATAGGRIGLVGRPAACFPEPWPAPSPTVTLDAETGEHLPVTLAGSLAPQPDMPDRYLLTTLADTDLHRRPTVFSGRVVSRLTGPAAGVALSVTLYWPTFAAIGGAGLAPRALSLWSGLYADRTNAATARRRSLNLQPDVKALVAAAPAGETRLLLSDRQNLLVGRPLAIEAGDPEREEYVAIAAIDASWSADQPAWVTLEHPLNRVHGTGAEVARTTFAGAAGPPNAFDRAARRGDVSLYLAGLAGITAANTIIEVDGGAAPGIASEYHRFSLWQAVTDADGHYRLPPIHRAAHIEIEGPGIGPVRFSLNAPGDALADILFD
jgi:hypothetical protein